METNPEKIQRIQRESQKRADDKARFERVSKRGNLINAIISEAKKAKKKKKHRVKTPAKADTQAKVDTIAKKTKEYKCFKCGLSIGWGKSKNGKPMPMNLDGTEHWDACSNERAKGKVYVPISFGVTVGSGFKIVEGDPF